MNFFDMFKIKQLSIPSKEVSIDYHGNVLNDADVTDPSLLRFSTPRYTTYGITPSYRPSNVTFYTSEYELDTIANAISLDGILNRSVCIFTEQILKNGYENVASTDQSQLHITRRIKEIELGTNIKYNETLTMIARQLVSYGNAYVIKVRGDSKFGKEYKLFNKTVKPIIGLFVADATTMKVGVNNNNTITHYSQFINGNEKIFKANDVIHLTYNRIPGTLTGNSNINAILDDLRALRKLEEEIEILGFQYSVPLYLYKVGNDNHPAQIGEIDDVSTTVNHMPTSGIMVVPHTHDMKAVTSNNDPIDLTKYVQYFKSRIYSGLGVAPVAMGDSGSSSRSTSEIADINMQTITKSYQQIIKNNIEQEFLLELLMDGNFDLIKHDVEKRFPEIDMEAQIKKETHILQKYQGNLITLTEARKEADYSRPINMADTFLSNVSIKLLDAQNQAAMDLASHTGDIASEQIILAAKVAPKVTGTTKPKAKAKTGGRGASVGKTSRRQVSKSVKSTSSKNNPTNQHGKQLGRPKTVKDMFDSGSQYLKGISDIYLADNSSLSEFNINNIISKVSKNYSNIITDSLSASVEFYKEYYHCDNSVEISPELLNSTIHYYSIIIKDKLSRLNKIKNISDETEKISYIIDSLVEFFDNDEKLDNLARIIILNSLGYNSILFNADTCDQHTSYSVDVTNITMDKIPPFKNGCSCKIEDLDGKED